MASVIQLQRTAENGYPRVSSDVPPAQKMGDLFLAACTILLFFCVWMVADTSASRLYTVVHGLAAGAEGFIIYLAVLQGVAGDGDEHPVRLTLV